MRKTVDSEEGTRALARTLAAQLKPPLSVGLSGPLGAGKTTLVRHVTACLGVNVPVSSPSYVLQHEYHGAGGLLIEHWDLYRLGNLPPELEEPAAAGVIRFIEWPDKIPGFSDSLDLVISIALPESLADTPERRIYSLRV